jgi:hypothetical protein
MASGASWLVTRQFSSAIAPMTSIIILQILILNLINHAGETCRAARSIFDNIVHSSTRI